MTNPNTPTVTPIIVSRKCGGFLALSPEDCQLQIGVEGATKEEVRRLFETSITSGLRILSEVAKDQNGRPI